MAVSTVIERELVERARRYAERLRLALYRVIEEALREYLTPRELDPSLTPLARSPRRAGRPSKLEQIRDEERLRALLKRTGRPLRAHREAGDNSAK